MAFSRQLVEDVNPEMAKKIVRTNNLLPYTKHFDKLKSKYYRKGFLYMPFTIK